MVSGPAIERARHQLQHLSEGQSYSAMPFLRGAAAHARPAAIQR